MLLSHVQIFNIFEKLFGIVMNEGYEFFPNGGNSIRIRRKDKVEYIFSYESEDCWAIEPIPVYIERMATYTALKYINHGTEYKPDFGKKLKQAREFNCRLKSMVNYIDRPEESSELKEVLFSAKEYAEDILKTMINLLNDYEVISIADYYDMSGIISNTFEDEKYGWYNLTGTTVIPCGRGYKIDLPAFQFLQPKENT